MFNNLKSKNPSSIPKLNIKYSVEYNAKNQIDFIFRSFSDLFASLV